MSTLTPEKEQLAIFLATPRERRPYTSLEKFAAALKRDHATVYRWKKEPAVKARVQEIIADAAGSIERVKAVVDAMYEAATARDAITDDRIDGVKPDVNAMRQYLTYVGVDMSGKPREVPVVAEDLSELSNDQLLKALDDIQALRAARALSEGEAANEQNRDHNYQD